MSKAIKQALAVLDASWKAELAQLTEEFEKAKTKAYQPFGEADRTLRGQCKHDGKYLVHENHHNGDDSYECEFCGATSRVWPPR